jgi:hypothetical protein
MQFTGISAANFVVFAHNWLGVRCRIVPVVRRVVAFGVAE